MVCSVGIFGKYDTYKGSTPKPPITIVSSSIIGKYDTYKGSTQWSVCIDENLKEWGNMILIKDRHHLCTAFQYLTHFREI